MSSIHVLNVWEVCSDVLRITPLDEYTTLFIHWIIKHWLFVSSLWDTFMDKAALNIHVQVLVGYFLGLESPGHRVGISFPLQETIIIHLNFSTHDIYSLFLSMNHPSLHSVSTKYERSDFSPQNSCKKKLPLSPPFFVLIPCGCLISSKLEEKEAAKCLQTAPTPLLLPLWFLQETRGPFSPGCPPHWAQPPLMSTPLLRNSSPSFLHLSALLLTTLLAKLLFQSWSCLPPTWLQFPWS